MDFSKFLHGFVKIDTGISLSCYLDLSKLLQGFVKVVLCISRLLPNKTKLKFDQDFKVYWSFCFELKVLNVSEYSMPWIRCALCGNVFWWSWRLISRWLILMINCWWLNDKWLCDTAGAPSATPIITNASTCFLAPWSQRFKTQAQACDLNC